MKKREIIIPIGPSIAYVELTQGKFACIEVEDAEWIGKFNWCVVRQKDETERFYAVRGVTLGGGKTTTIAMHVEILGRKKGMEVDHKSGFTLDNRRRGNLRRATKCQNKYNMKKNKNNTSGSRGVWFCRERDQWVAEIRFDNRKHFLGRFKEKNQAEAAYRAAAEKHHGEFRRAA